MGERKVLNRYFPPDFDPLLVPKRKYDPYKQVEVRMMIPLTLLFVLIGERPCACRSTRVGARE